MRHIAIVVCAVAALVSGCATTKVVPITAEAGAQMNGQTFAPTSRPRAGFLPSTPGKAAFAMAGAFAMIAAGNDLMSRYDLQDPSAAVSADLAQALAASKGGAVASTIDLKDVKEKDVASKAGEARYIVDVTTWSWGYGYQPADWAAFDVNYSSRLRVMDARTGAVVASGACTWTTPKTGKLHTQDALLADGAALLKSELATGARVCAAQYRREVLGGL